MTHPSAVSSTRSAYIQSPRDSLRRLWTMRNIALAGQVSVIAVTVVALHVPLPLAALAATVVLLAAFNALTWLRLRRDEPIREIEIFGQFWVDLTALTILLYFTGGATNPFVSFYLPLLAVAAAALRPRYVWFLSVFSLLAYSALGFAYVPLDIHLLSVQINYHLAGMWVNFVIGAGWIAWFVLQMSSALREREAALANAHQRLLQDARVVALGAQAARAAHELGTPLSSIAVAAGELRSAARGDTRLARYLPDIDVLDSELEKCRMVLDSLRRPLPAADADERILVASWLDAFAQDWCLRHPGIVLTKEFVLAPALKGRDMVLFGQVLTIILDNAARVSEHVHLHVESNGEALDVVISDQGDGFPAALLGRVGLEPVASDSGGRGWGLFLAHVALDSRGGSLRFGAREGGGTIVTVVWPLNAVENPS